MPKADLLTEDGDVPPAGNLEENPPVEVPSPADFRVNLGAIDGVSPDSAAKIHRLARHRGAPFSLVKDNQADFERADEADLLHALLTRQDAQGNVAHPVSLSWSSDPVNMAKAKDDVQTLLKLEAETRRQNQARDERDQVGELRNIGLAMGPDYARYVLERIPFGGSAARALGTIQGAMAMKRLREGAATDADRLTLQRELAKTYFESTRTAFADQAVDVVSNLPAFGAEFAATGGMYAAGRQALARAGEGALLRWSGRLMGTAAQAAANPAFVADRYASRLAQFPDEGFSEAMIKGFGDAFVEMASERAGGMLGKIPGVKNVNQWLKTAVVDRWLERRPGATLDTLYEVYRKAGWHGIVGEIMEERIGDVARAATGIQPLPYSNAQEFLKQLAVEGASFSMLPLAAAGAHMVLNQGRDVSRIGRSAQDLANHEADAAHLDEMVKQVGAAKLTARDPEAMGQFIEQVQQHGGVAEVYVDAKALQAVFAEENKADPAAAQVSFQDFVKAVGPEGLTDRQIDEALATGTPLTIRTAPYLARFASQIHDKIKGLISFDPKLEVTTAIVEERKKALQKMVEDLRGQVETARAAEAMPAQLGEVRRQMLTPKEQGGAGMTAVEADAQVATVNAMFRRLAERSDVSFDDLWSQYGGAFQVQTGDTPEAVKSRAAQAAAGVAANASFELGGHNARATTGLSDQKIVHQSNKVKQPRGALEVAAEMKADGVTAQTDDVQFQDERKKATPQRLAESFDQVRDQVKGFIGKALTNEDDGLQVTVSNTNLAKMLSGKAVNKSSDLKAHLLAVANVDHLFKNAVEDISSRMSDKAGVSDVLAWRRYWAPMIHNGEVLAVKLTVKELAQKKQGNRVYSLETVEINKPAGKWVDATFGKTELTSTPQAGSQEKLRHKFRIVNQDQTGASGSGEAARGALETTADGKKILHLFKSADRSTLQHEMLHLYLRMADRLIAAGKASDELRGDLRVLREWAGWKEGALTEKQEEKMARAFEAYLMEGKAPSVELAGAFARFRDWLARIYSTVAGLDVEINSEVRQVFDRMLAAEDEVAEAREFYAQGESLAELWERDQSKLAAWKKRRDEARQNQVSRQVKRALSAYFAAVGGKAGVERQAAKEVAAQPIYALLRGKAGVSLEDAREHFGRETAKALQERFPDVIREGGKSLAELAIDHGFDGSEALAEALKTAIPEAEAAQARADAILADMEARIKADVEAGGAAVTRADEAVHTVESLAVLAAEAQMLADEIGRRTGRRPDQLTEAAYRAQAQAIIAKKTVGDAVRYMSFARAERRFGRRVIEFLQRARGQARPAVDKMAAMTNLAEERAWQKVDDGSFGDAEVGIIAGKDTVWTAETAIRRLQDRLAVDRNTAWMIYNAALPDAAPAMSPVKVARLLQEASDYLREHPQGTMADRQAAASEQRGRAEMEAEVEQMKAEAAFSFLEALKRAGGIRSPSKLRETGDPLAAEVAMLLESKKIPGLVRNDAPGLDVLRGSLAGYGYKFEMVTDLLDALDMWARTGKDPEFTGEAGGIESDAPFQGPPKPLAEDEIAKYIEASSVKPTQKDRQDYERMLTEDEQSRLLQEALDARKLQLLNHALVLESMRVREEVQGIEARYKPSKLNAALKGLKNEFIDPVLTLLQRYGFTMMPPKAVFDFSKVADLDEKLAAMVPGWVARGEKAGWWKQTLTVADLRELDDFAKSLLASGRDAMYSLSAKAFATATEFANKCIARLSNIKDVSLLKNADGTWRQEGERWFRTLAFLQKIIDSHNHAQFVVKMADGGDVRRTGRAGPMQLLYEWTVACELAENKLSSQVLKELDPNLKILTAAIDRIQKANGKYFEIPDMTLGEQAQRVGKGLWTGEKLVAFLLNVGNEGNLGGLLSGYNLRAADVHQISKFFDSAELRAIQGVWDTIDTLYPLIDAVHFRLHDRHLPKGAAKPITLTARDGTSVTLAGGYYPKRFDSRLADRAARLAEENLQRMQGVLRADTQPEQGFTKARVGSNMPIKLSLGVLVEHLNDTTHFIHQAEVLKDWQNLLSDGPWRTAFVEKFGEDAWVRLKAWMSHQANPYPVESPAEDPTISGYERFIEWNRKMAVIAVLGFNVKTAMVQKTALINAGYQLGWKWIWRGYREMGLGGTGTALVGWKGDVWQGITAKSERMRQRERSVDRDIREAVGRMQPLRPKSIKVFGRELMLQDAQEIAFAFLTAMDRSVIAPTWLGAYAKYLETLVDKTLPIEQQEADAIAYADSIIADTQPSGLRAELNSIQRDPRAWVRFITMFSSWPYKQGSRYYVEAKAWRDGQISTARYANHIFHEVIFLTLVTTILRGAMRGDMPDWLDWLFDLLNAPLAWFPYLSSIPYALKKGEWDLDRAVPAGEGVKRAFKAGHSVFNEDKEWAEALWDVVRAGEFVAGTPVTNIPRDLKKMFEEKTFKGDK